MDFPNWLAVKQVPYTPDIRFRPEDQRVRREEYLRELAEARQGVAHFRLDTGEELRDDWNRYLEWELSPH